MQFFILAVSLFASAALVSVTSAAPNGGLRGSIDQTQTHRSLYSEVKTSSLGLAQPVRIKNDTPYDTQYDVNKPINVQYLDEDEDGTNINHRALQYSEVTIKNDTPFHSLQVSVLYKFLCKADLVREGIASGYTWQGPSRGMCLVKYILATLDRPEDKGGKLTCDQYDPLASTTHADYFIILIGNKCCVRSSYQTKECP